MRCRVGQKIRYECYECICDGLLLCQIAGVQFPVVARKRMFKIIHNLN